MFKPINPPCVNSNNETIKFDFTYEGKKYSSVKYKGGTVFDWNPLTRVAAEFGKYNKGPISRQQAIEMLGNIADRVGGKNDIAAIKSLFDIYMDPDSLDGTNISEQEQENIMNTLLKWNIILWKLKE